MPDFDVEAVRARWEAPRREWDNPPMDACRDDLFAALDRITELERYAELSRARQARS